MIDGVVVTPLGILADERGTVMHMLRRDDPHFAGFGEVYFSTIWPGVVKGWHRHRIMTLNYCVPFGRIKLVLYDDRPASSTRGQLMELFPAEDNHQLVTIPPGVWNGFKGLGTTRSIVANCATDPHQPDEIERLEPHSGRIPYDWARKDG